MIWAFRAFEVLARMSGWFGDDADHLKTISYPEEAGTCFKIAFESTAEPFITSQEVAESFKMFFLEGFVDELAENVRREYEQNFPESREPVKPRHLQQLCRFQVRQILRRKRALPYGVDDLPVPKLMKRYIVMKSGIIF